MVRAVRALVITEHGPPEVLRVLERPDPRPAQGELLVRVRAAGINFADILARTGLYSAAPKPPAVVGYEFAGEVQTDGRRFKAGDRVMGATRFGGHAELVAVPEGNLLPLRDDWSFEQGAAVPVTYSTAYAALVRYGSLRPGERILIHAAAGGVGSAAVQIAKAKGAGEVFGTASAAKHDAVRGFGVDHPIDYRTLDFAKEVRRITGAERALDLVLDGIGGNSFRKSFSLLRTGGRLVMYGVQGIQQGERRDLLRIGRTLARMPIFHPAKLMQDSKSVIGINMLQLWDDDPGLIDEYSAPVLELIEQGAIDPAIAETFPLERGADAHRFVGEGKNVGKVILTL
jgi:NADPH:quinone reductase-like Zn-dependent oxidoreductase